MAITVQITDGTTTVNLNDGTDAWMEAYNPQNFGASADAVTEGHQVTFLGGNSAVDTTWLKLEKLFLQARIWEASRKGARVYVTVCLDGSTTWRSELYDGRLLATGDIVKFERATGQRDATVMISRANWWEGAEAQIPLTNGNGSANTSGLNVFNCNDGAGSSPNKHHSYAAITGTDVAGDLPAETRIEITNNYAGLLDLREVWIGQNWTDPANFSHVLEAEAATGASGTAIADRSGGYVVRTTVQTTETTLCSWALNAAFLNACAGNYYKALMVRGNLSYMINQFKFRISVLWGSSALWRSGWVSYNGGSVMDIATFRLPPWLPSLTGLGALNLVLSAQVTTGTPAEFDVDFLMLMPVDGYRYLNCGGTGADTNRRVVDDGITRNLYQDDGSGTGKIGAIQNYGSPIQVYPGKDQRLYFVMTNVTSEHEIARTVSLKLWYRPRRLAL